MKPEVRQDSSIGVMPANETLVRELQPEDAGRWDAYARGVSGASLYHSILWRNFVQEVFGQNPQYLLCEQAGRIAGILPMFHIRLPILGSKLVSIAYDIGSGGALGIDQAVECALIEAAIRRAREQRVNYLELRYSEPHAAAEALGLVKAEPVIITELELDGERVWSRMKGDHRRSINTARQRGVVIREGASEADYLAFYRIMLRVFRAFGTPPYGPGYFRALWKLLHPSGASRLLLAYSGERCIGGMLLFCWGKVLIDKFCLALPEAASLRPTAALYARAIELGLELGFEKLNMGTSARTQTGLIEFKERWGATSRPAVFYSLPVQGKVPPIEKYYDSNGIVQKIWRKLPVSLTPLGGSLYRWFC